MAQLPKSLIKKYGISKKAWAVYRGRKHKRHSPKIKIKKSRRTYSMARKRHSKKVGSGRGMGGMFSKITSLAIGSAVAFGLKMFVMPLIPISGLIKNIVEIIGGLILATMKGMPEVVRSGGLVLATLGTYDLVGGLLGQAGI